jgi:CRISPR-associated protein Cas5h
MENSTLIQSKKVLVFDVSSEYAHFRKFNTTTSPLTYSIPPRPALVGLLGAILGIERELSFGKFKQGTTPLADLFTKNKASIAVQILKPIQKVTIGFNLLDTEKTTSSFFNIKQRTQIEFELLKNPKFRVFVAIDNENLFIDLVSRIKENKAHFTPYLGLSQFTACLEYVGLTEVRLLDNADFQEVITSVNLSNIIDNNQIEFNYNSQEFKYTSDTMPVEMQSNRIVIEYAEIVMEVNGKPLKVKSKQTYQTNYGNILFL